MAVRDNNSQFDSEERTTTLRSLTRRTALGLIGGGGIASLTGSASASGGVSKNRSSEKPARLWNRDVDANGHDLFDLRSLDVEHVYTSARDADVIVWRDKDGVFHADSHDGEVASGPRVLPVTQAAVDSLSEDRTSKEKVLIASPGEVRSGDGPLEIPSHTTLDAPVTLSIPSGEDVGVVVRGKGAEHFNIDSLNIDGPASMAIRLTSCSNVRLGDLRIHGVTSDGVRIDGRQNAPRSTDIQIDQLFVKDNGHHGLETYGVDRIQVDQVVGVDPESCVVLLNDTADATVNSVVGLEPGGPAGYATFRVANGAHDITVGEVVSRGGNRGIFGVSECYNITIGEVNIDGAEDQGILVQNCQNFAVEGGVVKNTNGDGVRIDSRNDGEQTPAEGVSISNLRVYDDRDEPRQTWGILETGPGCHHNRIVGNDVRDGGTVRNIGTFSNTTIVRNNVGGGFSSGEVTLEPGQSPAARVEGVSSFDDVTIPGSADNLEDFEPSALELRAKPVTAGSSLTYAWDHYFEYDGSDGEWDLVFEWRTDPGAALDVDFVVDKTR